MSKVLENLNEQQEKAVLCKAQRLVIVAGAGTGKTRTLTHRIARFIEDGTANLEQILAITFTNKAADVLKERVMELIGLNSTIMQVSTFHSFCLKLIRQHTEELNLDPNFTVYDEDDSEKLLKQVIKDDLGEDPKKFPLRDYQAEISYLKNNYLTPDEVDTTRYFGKTMKMVPEIYKLYQIRLTNAKALDFDDLLFFAVKLLKENPELRDLYHKKYRHIFVDEFQDINYVQNLLIELLYLTDDKKIDDASSESTISVVGDADQSIYKFRGSEVKNLINFDEHFGKSEKIILSKNYRSQQNILNVANGLIKNNHEEYDKNLFSDLPILEKTKIIRFDNDKIEAKYIATKLKKAFLEDPKSLKNYVVLYRNNSFSRSIEEALINAKLPYRIFGGIKFYSRKEIKDIIAYLRVIQNPDDLVALNRIINRPTRGIGATSYDRLVEYSFENLIPLSQLLLDPQSNQNPNFTQIFTPAISKFSDLLNHLITFATTNNVEDLTKEILKKTEYIKMLKESQDTADQERIDSLMEFLSICNQYTKDNPEGNLGDFLDRISLYTDLDDLEVGEGSYVSLMTLHKSKGTEFNEVFIIGLEENILPSSQDQDTIEGIQEERRLLYVGITRAKHQLYLCYVRKRFLYGQVKFNPVSRFLKELPQTEVKVTQVK